MNGIELVRRLKQRHLSYPVILITSGTAYDLLERAAGSGIREVLEKPLQDGTLLDRIKEALAASACDRR
jgi:FixJ family two-component response regulator